MAWEIEVKFQVDSHEPVRARLAELQAERRWAALERNILLDRPDEELFRRGMGLRVRTRVYDDGRPPTVSLTVKGPRTNDTFKSREEVKTQVADAAAVLRMLELLGYVPVVDFEKRRESWLLRGCLVDLDEPAELGLFVEVEGPDEASIVSVQQQLPLDAARMVSDTYVGMAVRRCDELGLRPRVLRLPGEFAR